MASRVAEERGSILGGEIGYTIRFEDCSEEAVTKVKVWSPKWWKNVCKVNFNSVYNCQLTYCFYQ